MAKRKKETRLKIYQDFMTQAYMPIQVYKTPPYPHQEYPILVSTKRAPRYYIAPQSSIENAYLLETRKLLSVLI